MISSIISLTSKQKYALWIQQSTTGTSKLPASRYVLCSLQNGNLQVSNIYKLTINLFLEDKTVTWTAMTVTWTAMVMILPDPFEGWGRGDSEVKLRPKVKIGRSSAKDGAPKRLWRGIIQEWSKILRLMTAGAARILLPFYPA